MRKAAFTDGAVAFIDALGFKGIWRRDDVKDDPDRVLKKMRVLERAFPGFVVKYLLAAKWTMPSPALLARVREHIALAAFSDTVVIGASSELLSVLSDEFGAPEEPIEPGRLAVLAASSMAQIVIRCMGKEPVPLAVRGCIARGAFAIERNFVLGPAVDEAAEAASLADAAIVWLLPSAAATLEAGDADKDDLLVEHLVPLKGGATLLSPCVVPFIHDVGRVEDEETICRRLLRTFDSTRVDICVKRQHTQVFLRACLRAAPKVRGRP